MSELDEFGHHEVSHMATAITKMWYDWICTHPAVEQDKLIKEKGYNIFQALNDFNNTWEVSLDSKFNRNNGK